MTRVAAAGLLTALAGVGVVTAVVLRRDGSSSLASKRQAARSGPVVLGTAFRVALTQRDPRYRAQLLSHGYGSLTPEYEMYMDSVEGTRGVFDFVQADRAVSFARVHGMTIRGHTLVWGRQLPTWLTRPSMRWTRATLLPVMEQWIRTMVGHYAGATSEWDIVNEPLNENGSLKRNLWERVIGPDYIRIALQTAHTADPTALLFINDYSTEWLDPKSNALFALARTLRRAGVPLGGIGFQLHSDSRWPVVESQLEANMKRFGGLGLRTDITEMDVNTSSFAGTQQAKLNAQARIYSDAAEACGTSPTCWTFTTWGFTDKYTWLGTAGQPLPFAANYSAKPAWAAVTARLAK
jgi:endo-1,4-beta-xylanase